MTRSFASADLTARWHIDSDGNSAELNIITHTQRTNGYTNEGLSGDETTGCPRTKLYKFWFPGTPTPPRWYISMLKQSAPYDIHSDCIKLNTPTTNTTTTCRNSYS